MKIFRLGNSVVRQGNLISGVRWGNGLLFDGVNDWINLGAPPTKITNLGGSSLWTIAATIYPNANRGVIFSTGGRLFNDAGPIAANPSGVLFGITTGSSSSFFRFTIRGNANSGFGQIIYLSQKEFPISNYYTFAFTKVSNNRDVNDIRLFVNGVEEVLQLTNFVLGSWPSWSLQSFISATGDISTGFSGIYSGVIFDLAICNSSWTESNYLTYMRSREATSSIFHLRFDQNRGGFIRDITGSPLTVNVSSNFGTTIQYLGGAWVTFDRQTSR